jgi:hypothetical protein
VTIGSAGHDWGVAYVVTNRQGEMAERAKPRFGIVALRVDPLDPLPAWVGASAHAGPGKMAIPSTPAAE